MLNGHYSEEWQQLLHGGKIAFFGWALHFRMSLLPPPATFCSTINSCPIVPFLIMGRVTYIHHYVRESSPFAF